MHPAEKGRTILRRPMFLGLYRRIFFFLGKMLVASGPDQGSSKKKTEAFSGEREKREKEREKTKPLLLQEALRASSASGMFF